MIPRWQTPIIESARKTRRVLLIEGARQCGKTTIARSLTGDTEYRTLDDITMREAVESDLKAFLQTDAQMLIIDEIQRAPDLIPEIKRVVDLENRPGQFLLTGSAHIPSLPQVQESLAGRISHLRLRPFSQGEINQSKPDFLDRIVSEKIIGNARDFSKKNLIKRALKGGYPEIQDFNDRDRRKWHRDYISAMMSRDLKDISGIQKIDQVKKLVDILAAWSSKLMDISAIGSDLSVARPTLESYIAALQTLFLIERLPAWTKTDYARVGKKDTLFMTDSGLMASLLKYRSDTGTLNDDQVGKLAEVFVFNELKAITEAHDGRYEMFHYRDNSRREIDFLIDDEDGGLIGIEVKAGLTVKSDHFKHLRWFKENLAKDRLFHGIVLYSGTDVVPFGENLWAVPTSYLWG